MSNVVKGGIALLIVFVLGWVFLKPNSSKAAEAETGSFVLSAIEKGNIKRAVSTSGTVQPLIKVEIGSQLSGQLIEVLVDFNDEVEADQVLARIDPDTFQSRVEEARAQLKISQASLSVARANLKRSKASLEQRKTDLSRFEPLLEYDAISEIEVDAAKAQYGIALADYEASLAQVENARAVVSQRNANLQQAEVDLQRTEIKAPINGVIINRNIDKGQTVAASLQAPVLFELAQDLSKIQIEADVNEADIGAIKQGNEVSFTVDAYSSRTFKGAVQQVRLAPKNNANIVTYTVIIHADNPGKILYPGMTASVEIVTGEKNNVLKVKNSVLRYKPASATESKPQRGNPTARLEKLAEEIGLSKEQKNELQKRMRALFQSGERPQNPRQAVEKIYRSVLTEEQFEQYKNRSNNRRGTLYTLDDNGQPAPIQVRLGLSDNQFTEVISDELSEGSQIIQREKKE